MQYVRPLWTKSPESDVAFFAFEAEGRVGFIDVHGKIVIPATIAAPIENVGDFHNGLAVINRGEASGYLNSSGQLAIRVADFPKEANTLYSFSEGLGRVMLRGRTSDYKLLWLLLQPDGAIALNLEADWVSEFSGGFASITTLTHGLQKRLPPAPLVGYVNRTGSVVVEPKFAFLGRFSEGLAAATVDGQCFRLSPDGGRTGSASTGVSSSCGDPPKEVREVCRVGFIDGSGTFRIEPQFETGREFREGLAAVRIEEKWGFVDTGGEITIEPKYLEAQSFSEGLAAVRLEGWGYIDRNGNVAIPGPNFAAGPFSQGLAAVSESKDKWKFLNASGEVVIPGPFLEATPFAHGLAAVLLPDNVVRYVNLSGQTVFEYRRSDRRW